MTFPAKQSQESCCHDISKRMQACLSLLEHSVRPSKQVVMILNQNGVLLVYAFDVWDSF